MQFDIAIIGGGHNGLVCSAYLAEAGLKVLVLEQREIVGGAAVTEEFHPGYRNSTASYTVSLLQPKIIEDLRLYKHGLQIIERPFSNFLPLRNGDHLRTGESLAATQRLFARHSPRDAANLPAYFAMLTEAVRFIRQWALKTPPNRGSGLKSIVDAVRSAMELRRLPLQSQAALLDLFTKSAGEILDDYFENDAIKALFGFDSIVGSFASPYTPGSAYVLLHHVFGETNGKPGTWGHAIGGMGAITQAMLSEALARGVTVRTNARVSQVLTNNGRTTGLVIDEKDEISVPRIAANVTPKRLFNELLSPDCLQPEFTARMRRYKCGSGSFRINVALSELPKLQGIDAVMNAQAVQSGIVIGPSLQYMEQAYFDARTEGWSRQPIVEMLVPSTVDPTLAPPGRHVASLFCQHFNPRLPDGQSWDANKDAAVSTVLDTVNQHVPNFRQSVLAVKALSPLDLERTFGLTNGDIFHGALSLDQLFSARPLLGYADYRTPIKGLYLCGSGTHPGGGVSGAPGYNAAREILRDARKSMPA